MPPIRVGIIGLSARTQTAWASSAHLPYFQSQQNKYIITALCNSSVPAAKSAIEEFKLPASTKAYGNPEDLANDKENLSTAKELNDVAKANGSRTVVGLQGQKSSVVWKIKSLIAEDRIGKVLSSCIAATGGSRDRETLIEGLEYFTKKDVGGNMVTIGFGHMADYVTLALGELSSFQSLLSIQRPQVPILDRDGKVVETVTSDVPDHIMFQGTLKSRAPLSITFRRGQPFKDSFGFTWYIHGEKGEIKLTAGGPLLQAFDAGTSLSIHDFKKDEVKPIEWDQPFKELPGPARNVAAMYEAFADGSGKYPDFEHAVLRHEMIDELYKSSEESRKGVYI